MANNIMINIKANELKSLLLDYYQSIYPNEIKDVEIISKKENTGLYETTSLVTKIKLIKNIKIGKFLATVEEIISDEDIKQIINLNLEDNNYQIESITRVTKSRLEGLYEYEEIYFDGIEVYLKSLEHQKQICKHI